jgi:hypothetical protein
VGFCQFEPAGINIAQANKFYDVAVIIDYTFSPESYPLTPVPTMASLFFFCFATAAPTGLASKEAPAAAPAVVVKKSLRFIL